MTTVSDCDIELWEGNINLKTEKKNRKRNIHLNFRWNATDNGTVKEMADPHQDVMNRQKPIV
jgi:hypothetical protein